MFIPSIHLNFVSHSPIAKNTSQKSPHLTLSVERDQTVIDTTSAPDISIHKAT